MTLLLALALLAQEETLESLARKLASDEVQVREKAAAELARRAESAMEAIRKADARAEGPSEKARLRRALEEIQGAGPLTPERLKAAKVTCSLSRINARAAAEWLQKLSGIPVEVDAPAGIDPVLHKLEGTEAPLDLLLDSLAAQTVGSWILDGRRVLLVVSEKIPVRLYDVRDLTAPFADDARLCLEPEDTDWVAVGEEWSSPLTGENVAHLLETEIAPGRWEEADGKSCSHSEGGWLIVRNDPDVHRAVGPWLETVRRRFLPEVRIEIEAYAVGAGRKVEEATIERLREESREGKTARRVASFDRTARNQRRIALGSLARTVLLTRYDEMGWPVTAPFTTGTKANVRTWLDDGRRTVRVELEAGWSRLLSVERRKEPAGEVQEPTFANHVLSITAGIPAGRLAVLGRIGETRIAEGLGDIVVVGRFTPVER